MNDRVPPGQHLVSGFPVLHVRPVPPFDPKTWRLRVFGLVAEEKKLHLHRDHIGYALAAHHCPDRFSLRDHLEQAGQHLGGGHIYRPACPGAAAASRAVCHGALRAWLHHQYSPG